MLEDVPVAVADALGLVSSLERAAGRVMGRRMTTREVSWLLCEGRDEAGADLARRLASLMIARGWQVHPDPALEADVLLCLGKLMPRDENAASSARR